MKDINHIVLDFEKNNSILNNWTLNFLNESKNYISISSLYNFKKNYFIETGRHNLLIKQKKSTLVYSNKLNLKNYFSKKEITSYFSCIHDMFHLYILNAKNNKNLYSVTNDLYKLVNINFLRKERLYTKLKYSRSPAYDIVSGGAAALLAGFIGFLISEKYGFELVDSGDFYYLFMYLVFLTFSIRPLLTSISTKDKITTLFSLNFLLKFYQSLFYIFIRIMKF